MNEDKSKIAALEHALKDMAEAHRVAMQAEHEKVVELEQQIKQGKAYGDFEAEKHLHWMATAQALEVKVKELEQQLARLKDDQELDCTDDAHPAWWRGHDDGSLGTAMRMEDAADGKDDGAGVLGSEALERTRRKILALRQQLAQAQAACAAYRQCLNKSGWKPCGCPGHWKAHAVNCPIGAVLSMNQDGKGWLSPDEAKALEDKAKESHNNAVFNARLHDKAADEAKALQAQCAAMREALDYLSTKWPEEDDDVRTMHATALKALSTTAGRDLLERLERYEKAFEKLETDLDLCWSLRDITGYVTRVDRYRAIMKGDAK